MKDATERFRRALAREGCEKVARQLPIESASITWNELGFYVARVDLKQDEFCSNGVFSIATAVDLSSERAILRASFEAVERYCLGAIGAHSGSFKTVSSVSDCLIRFREGSCESFEYAKSVMAVPATIFEPTLESKLVAIGDAFAPYPKRDGNIGAPSTTNGVGCHRSLDLACQSAALELLERHWIMNYWFMSRANARWIDFPSLPHGDWMKSESVLKNLGYEIKLIRISDDEAAPAILGFAFHRDGLFPAGVCAASMKHDGMLAVEACLLEILQTTVALAFSTDQFDYWRKNGEPMVTLDHNMFALAKLEHARIIRDTIEVETVRFDGRLGPSSMKIDLSGLAFVDVTRPDWKDEVRVVRAVSDHHFKLVVGDKFGEKRLLKSIKRLPLPHPFP